MRGRNGRRIELAAGALVALCLVLARTPVGADYEEYKVKAAFLLNFARLVTWPGGAEPAAGSPFVVGVAGGASVAEELATALAGASIPDHPVSVRRVAAPEEIDGCQILFVAGSDAESARSWARGARGSHALVVGESDGFASHGGAVNFFMEDRKVRFEINPKAADREGLKISSRLLQLAQLVSDEG